MAEFKVNADFLINVNAFVEAENEEEAKRKAIASILSKDCEFEDPIAEPKINWVEFRCDRCDSSDIHDHCEECGDISTNGDSLCLECQMIEEF